MCSKTSLKILYLISLIALLPCSKQNKSISKRSTLPSKVLFFADSPFQEDMPTFLSVLSNIVTFYETNKTNILEVYRPSDVLFGIFITNVNLVYILENNNERTGKYYEDIYSIINRNRQLLGYFADHMERCYDHSNPDKVIDKRISSMLSDEVKWTHNMKTTNVEIESYSEPSPLRKLEKVYYEKEEYLKMFDEFVYSIPSVGQSYKCMASMVKNDVRVMMNQFNCTLEDSCYKLFRIGSDVGDGLMNRLAWLIMAHYGRGCVIFDGDVDRNFMMTFCTKAFSEANYIALIGYPVMDLLLMQTSLCALEGHVEFLKRTWLMKAREQQATFGCFVMNNITKTLNRSSRDVCDISKTGFASGTFAAAVRYLIDVYDYS